MPCITRCTRTWWEPQCPRKSGRFPKAERVRLPEKAYLAQRTRYLAMAPDAVIEAARRLEHAGDAPLADRYFPELALAWRGAQGADFEIAEGRVDAMGLRLYCDGR